MSEESKVDTIEINDTAPAQEPEAKGPTVAELKEQGWSEREIQAAEKQGRVRKEKKKEEEPEPKAEVAAEEAKPEAEEKPTEPEDKKQETKKPAGLPDFSLSPEQEKAFSELFPPGSNPRGLYFRMKNERQARQAAEARLREMEERIKAIESGKAAPEVQIETDEEGNPIDPDEKPLTMKQLREMQKKALEEQQKQQEEQQKRQSALSEAQRGQEEYARSMIPDFDEKIEKAKDIIKRFSNGTIDEIIPEPWKQKKLVTLWNSMRYMAERADQVGLDDYNAAFIAYEIGEFHPEASRANGQRAESRDGKPNDPNKANGGLTPEQMKRLENTTQRRASSASIPGGGGKRTISVEDVGLAELNRMSHEERRSFKERHPDRYAKLLRG